LGSVKITGVAPRYTDPATIAAAFVDQDIFDNIVYTGFASNDANDFGALDYEFKIEFDIREIEADDGGDSGGDDVGDDDGEGGNE